MPRSRSKSILSSNCAFSSRAVTVCVAPKRRSANVLFPWSMCAIMQKFRMCFIFSVIPVVVSLASFFSPLFFFQSAVEGWAFPFGQSAYQPRFPSGQAFRFIFCSTAFHKRMPLQSLTRSVVSRINLQI